ncbi:putative polyketide synthase protein [Xylariomycetidae sp. FL2044]|nr:putative polyketide synthase protein [Xylariomycetidae sp. FL2044]
MSVHASAAVDVPRPKSRIKVTLTGLQETAMACVGARALDAQLPQPILGDVFALRVMDQVDYDISKFHIGPMQRISQCIRAKHFDNWTREFLAENPEATVIHLAAGLDARCLRVNWDSPNVRWVDVDFPKVVHLRDRILPHPAGDYHLIATEATDEAWIEKIPADRPTLVLMAGFTMYLDESAGRRLFQRLVDHFETGSLAFDCIGTVVKRRQHRLPIAKESGSVFKWVIDDAKILEDIHPRLEMLDCKSLIELPDLKHFPLIHRLVLSACIKYYPAYRNFGSYVRYTF